MKERSQLIWSNPCLGSRNEDPSANVGDGEEQEGLAASELRAEVAGEKTTKDGADPENAR